MRNRLFATVACMAWACLMTTFSAKLGLAADAQNYTGKYSLQERKNGLVISDSDIEVVQTENDLEVTTIHGGKRTTNRYPFDGSEADYVSPGGVPGKCKGQFKGRQLILDSTVASRPQPNAPIVRQHTKQRWQLSADSKTLTIQTDVDFPDVPASVSAAVAGDVSDKQKYIRLGGR
jgi:hypothetical protein